MLDIKLICTDLDGTILERGESIPEDTQVILAEAVHRGVKIATASGRPLEQQLQVLERNDLGQSKGWPHALIANESHIYLLDGCEYQALEAWNRRVYEEWMKALPSARRTILQELQHLEQAGVKVRRHITDEEATRRDMIDLWFDHVEDALAAEARLSRRLDREECDLQCNRNYCLIQLLHSLAGKGNTISALASHLGLRPEQVLVVGDSGNDLSMLDGRHGFHQATVSNADLEVKSTVAAHGGYVASQPRSKGIAEILEKIVLQDGRARR